MLEVLAPTTLIRVQSWSVPSCRVPVQEQLGVAWPMEVGAVACGKADVLCIGPTQWLLEGRQAHDAVGWMRVLTEQCQNTPFRATDLSAGLARIQVAGPDARSMLSKGTGVDLHPESFVGGQCVRTRFAGMPVIIRCVEGASFVCIVTTSYHRYLWEWLQDAAAEFT